MRRGLLRALAEASGPPGREGRVAAIVRPELEALCATVEQDPFGTLVGVRPAARDDAPRLALAAHMDEIGLMVTHVDDAGFLRVIPLGGWDPRTLLGQRVLVHGRRDLLGVVGTTPVHLQEPEARTRAPKIEALAVDVGLPGDEARGLVRPGDVITRQRDLVDLGHLVTGKSLDDRVGVFVMLEALRAAPTSECEVHAAATVQEEVGLRGARVLAERVRPHVGLAIETSPSDDGPGGRPGGTARVGRGAAIRMMDASHVSSPAAVDLLTRLAEERGIPHQFHVANRGGTDTRELQLGGDGAVASCVAVPTRYIHSSVECCHPDDVEAAIALVAAFIETAHEALAPAPGSGARPRGGKRSTGRAKR